MDTETKPLRWGDAKVADICEECSDPIRPGDEMAAFNEVYFSDKRRQVTKHYCKGCGDLLEDSLTTTGDQA
jgi:hypothetical protein